MLIEAFMVPMNGPADGRLEAPKAERGGSGRVRRLKSVTPESSV